MAFVSFGSAAHDAAGDVTSSAVDAALGITVYVQAADESANSKRAIGVQRGIDADVDAMPETKQVRLGRTLA